MKTRTLLAIVCVAVGSASAARAQMLEWTRQMGNSTDDKSFGVSADGTGNVYISGRTDGSLEGDNAGHLDTFISKYDASGNLLWTRQMGTRAEDDSCGVSADGMGNVYISGYTNGSLGGDDNAGDVDAFLVKFSDHP